jgi:hypothetical protein
MPARLRARQKLCAPERLAGSLASPVTRDGIANNMKTIRFFAPAGDLGTILAKRERDEGW